MSERARRIVNMVLAVLIALGGWVFVVYNFDPMTNVRYKDIPIRFIGEDELAQRGFAVTDSSYESIYVVLTQRRVKTGSISSADISVVADVSASVEGQNEVSLQITTPEGTQIAQSETRTITVDVEPVETTEVDISVAFGEESEEDIEPIVTELVQTRATVVGASSEIGSVARVIAFVDESEVKGVPRSFKRNLEAVDAEGNILPHMVIYPEDITFDAAIGYTRTVRLDLNVVDNSDDSYDRIYTAPETVTIKGPKNAVNKVGSIETEEISITRVYEDTDIDIGYVLPEGIMIADSSLGQQLNVKIRMKGTREETGDGEETEEDSSNSSDSGEQ